jgi:hypothetical protein
MDNSMIPPVPSSAQTVIPPPASPPASPTSTSAIMALVLGILSLACCGFFTGIPAIFLGRSELKAIEEGRNSESNRALAKIGMILGIIGTVIMVLFGLGYILLIILGISTGMMQDMH